MGRIGRGIRAAKKRLEGASSACDDEAAVCRCLPHPGGMSRTEGRPTLLVRCAHLVFRPPFPQTLPRERRKSTVAQLVTSGAAQDSWQPDHPVGNRVVRIHPVRTANIRITSLSIMRGCAAWLIRVAMIASRRCLLQQGDEHHPRETQRADACLASGYPATPLCTSPSLPRGTRTRDARPGLLPRGTEVPRA